LSVRDTVMVDTSASAATSRSAADLARTLPAWPNAVPPRLGIPPSMIVSSVALATHRKLHKTFSGR
jgi:hypothetical protein